MTAANFTALDDSNFDGVVLQRQGLTIVDFWSSTCAPCRQLTRMPGQLQPELPDNVLIGQVNADENSAMIERFGVRALPTVLFVRDGEAVETRTGVDRRQGFKENH